MAAMSRNQLSQKISLRVLNLVLLFMLLIAILLPVESALVSQSPSVKPQPSAATVQPSPARAPVVTREKIEAPSLGGAPLPYRVLVPPDYAQGSKRYAVLYLLHGLTGNEDDWWDRSKLAQYAARYRLIIVTPGVGDSWYANSASDPRARYEDAIIRDLIPHIDAHYRTIASREGRAIAGLSMGGLGAMKFALRYPQLFAFAASFSGAFDVPMTARLGKSPGPRMLAELRRVFGDERSQTRTENDVVVLLQQPLPKDTRFPHLYVSTGKSDPLPQVALGNPRFAEALKARKLDYEYYERPGTHDWRFWDSEINIMLGRMCVFMPQICS
ncbi:MAG TPA: alpha/beta hydrolase family protein [Pyrinomonadaceae bacterium]|jgi:S-formylglutathione hydrolase